MRPVGRGTLLDMLLGVLRPKYGLDDEREAEDIFGIVLCTVIVGCREPLVGGRGTDRDIGEDADGPPDLAVLPLESDPPLCGGGGAGAAGGCGLAPAAARSVQQAAAWTSRRYIVPRAHGLRTALRYSERFPYSARPLALMRPPAESCC